MAMRKMRKAYPSATGWGCSAAPSDGWGPFWRNWHPYLQLRGSHPLGFALEASLRHIQGQHWDAAGAATAPFPWLRPLLVILAWGMLPPKEIGARGRLLRAMDMHGLDMRKTEPGGLTASSSLLERHAAELVLRPSPKP